MKNYLHIFLLIIFISCDSPLDVPADKIDEKVIDDPFLKDPVIDIIPDSVNLGYIFPNEEFNGNITIQNIKNKRNQIDDYQFSNDYFELDFEEVTLQPQDQSGDSKEFRFTFRQEQPGEYKDTLIFSGMLYPYLPLKAIVPHVFGYDLSFENTNIDSSPTPSIMTIYNKSDETVEITELVFSDNDIFYMPEIQNNDYPIPIYSNDKIEILVSFNPQELKSYSEEVQIKISNDLILKEKIKLMGSGVK